MKTALSTGLLAAILLTGAPIMSGDPATSVALAAEAAKPEAPEKPPRRLSNSPDNVKKRECDAKWKVHKKEVKAAGWKPYFTFMANCM